MNPTRTPRGWLHAAATTAAALLTACATPTQPPQPPVPAAVFPPSVGAAGVAPAGGAPAGSAPAGVAPAVVAPAAGAPVAPGLAGRVSAASSPRAYRKEAAAHLYGLNHERIFAGRLPPMLYAIGVLEVDVDARGEVRRVHWLRAPRHAPEVVREIERTVRAAAPFPVPARMGRVTYVDTWLWDRSGRFQLDTLTEGQD